ncbi:MAG: S-adenosylmethionine synthetase, partial [Candidatus Bathyarchaeota archaeon]
KIYEQVPGIQEVYIWLLSQIGQPIDQPAIAAARVVLESGNSLKSLEKSIEAVMNTELQNIDKFTMDLASGKIPIC